MSIALIGNPSFAIFPPATEALLADIRRLSHQCDPQYKGLVVQEEIS